MPSLLTVMTTCKHILVEVNTSWRSFVHAPSSPSKFVGYQFSISSQNVVFTPGHQTMDTTHYQAACRVFVSLFCFVRTPYDYCPSAHRSAGNIFYTRQSLLGMSSDLFLSIIPQVLTVHSSTCMLYIALCRIVLYFPLTSFLHFHL